jgi:hypothetical protein
MMGNFNVGQPGYPPSQNIQGMQNSGQYPNYQQQNTQMFMANRNFKTVPCKYYHSPQGCVKANNCTFIHD